MKTLKWFVSLIVISTVLGGCPYQSKVPIDNPTMKINPALLGKWEPKSSSDEKYSVTKTDDYNYRIEKSGKDSNDKAIYKAFLSMIDTHVFLNVQDMGESSDKSYALFKIDVNPSGTKVTLKSVTENITEKFATPAELKAFFQKYENLSFFYDKTEEVYIKAD